MPPLHIGEKLGITKGTVGNFVKRSVLTPE